MGDIASKVMDIINKKQSDGRAIKVFILGEAIVDYLLDYKTLYDTQPSLLNPTKLMGYDIVVDTENKERIEAIC